MGANLVEIMLIKAGKDSDKENLEMFAAVSSGGGEPQVFLANIARPLDGEKIDSHVSRSGYSSA